MSDTYGISFVGDEALPPGHDFAFVTTPEGAWVFYRESALCPQAIEDSWAAGRVLRSLGDLDPAPALSAAESSDWYGLTATTG